jgi:hypothetical protein
MADDAKPFIDRFLGPYATPAAGLISLIALAAQVKGYADAIGWRVMTWLWLLVCLLWGRYVLIATKPNWIDESVQVPAYTRKTKVAAVALVVLSLVPAVFAGYKTAFPNKHVVTTSVVPVTIKSNSGVSVSITNRSNLPESLSEIRLTLSQTGIPIQTAGWRTYSIAGSIDSNGLVVGSAETQYPQSETFIKYSVKGQMKRWNGGGWQLEIEVPLREEIDGNGHSFIALLLPDSMDVTSESNYGGLVDLGDYLTGDSRNVFQLKRFLTESEKMRVDVTLTYGDGESSTYKGVIDF